MPIGAGKAGVLGAGLVPGGSETFNSSGTYTVPAGVTKVNVTGVGAAGTAGNPGNAGGAGPGGAGGSGGHARSCPSGCIVNYPNIGTGYAGGTGAGGSGNTCLLYTSDAADE